MFNENLKTLRKAKGLSQEQLAIQLNVVRQTISKWEKGLSIPDADMLMKIAEVFQSSISELLGTKILDETDTNNLVEQLVKMNEQLAIRNKRTKFILKLVVGIILTMIVLNLLFIIVSMISFKNFQNNESVKLTQESEILLLEE